MKPKVSSLHISTPLKLRTHPRKLLTPPCQLHSEEEITIKNTILTNIIKNTQRTWWKTVSNGTCIRCQRKKFLEKSTWLSLSSSVSSSSGLPWASCSGKDSSCVLLTKPRNHNLVSRITSWDQKPDKLFHKLKSTKELSNTLQFNQTRFNHNTFKLDHKFQLLPETLLEPTLLSDHLSEWISTKKLINKFEI